MIGAKIQGKESRPVALLAGLLDTADFPPRWHCGNWTAAHGWLHVLSDTCVFAAYFTIPCILGWFILRKRDLPFRWIFVLFGMFILACGSTHLMEAAIFWWPAYRLAGLLKLTTAVVSWMTVLALVPAIPKALAMRSPEELEREIERRRTAEQELQRANAELERRVQERTADLERVAAQLADADRRKTEFLALLAHELRNPLAPIRSGIEVLRLTPGDPATVATVQAMMERQMRQLVTLVDDLLDISRITRGKLELRRGATTLQEVTRAGVEASEPGVRDRLHEMTVTLPSEPIPLDVDPHRLSQVVSNLVNNAAKYTPEGGRIEVVGRQEGDEAVLLVRDSGRGIPPDLLPHVFDMFVQGDPVGDPSSTGLGIGLTLAKSLIEMHGGAVAARSEGRGRGSELEVRLPVAAGSSLESAASAGFGAVARPGTDEPAASRAPPVRVLVVDDNEDAAASLSMLLGANGHDARVATSGEQALRLGEELRPEVIFLDLGMPDMDGFAVARELRATAWGRDAVLVALTGWGQEPDRRRTREAGFDSHLVKPADPEEIRRILERRRA